METYLRETLGDILQEANKREQGENNMQEGPGTGVEIAGVCNRESVFMWYHT